MATISSVVLKVAQSLVRRHCKNAGRVFVCGALPSKEVSESYSIWLEHVSPRRTLDRHRLKLVVDTVAYKLRKKLNVPVDGFVLTTRAFDEDSKRCLSMNTYSYYDSREVS